MNGYLWVAGVKIEGGWEMEAEFKRPTLLPATLGCYIQKAENRKDDAVSFVIASEDASKEVLTGTLSKIG